MGQTEKTGVICRRCAAPIPIAAPEKVAEEFALTCPKCGGRAFYAIKDIKTLREC